MDKIILTKKSLLDLLTKAWFEGNKAPRDEYNGEIAYLKYRKQVEAAIDQATTKTVKES